MERSLIRVLLQNAEIGMLEADLLVARQRKVIRELNLSRKDTSPAEDRLNELQKKQARCIRNRDRLLAELGDYLDS
jgi:hypothetical protein